MAHEHNKAAAYLRTKRHLYYSLGIGLAAFMMWIMGAAAGYYYGSASKGVGSVFVAASVAFAAWCMAFLWKKEDKLWNYFMSVGGELVVAEQLRQLLDEYHVFHGVRPSSRDGDIDHVVVGPTGVFCLDTKVWNKRTRQNTRITLSKAEALKNRLMCLRTTLGFTRGEGPYFRGALVFLATDIPGCHNPYIDWVLAQQLVDYIRRTSGRHKLTNSEVMTLVERLGRLLAQRAR